MAKNDIGGFFVSLGLDIDKGAFDTGNKLIDGMGNSCNKLIGSARNATNILSSLTMEVSKIGGTTYQTAQQFGMTTEALNLWRTTARMATDDSKALDYALNRLSDVKVGIKTGKDFSSFTQQLSFLKMSYKDLEGKETGEQLQTILEHALTLKISGKEDTQYITKQIQDLLGKGAAEVFLKIADSGKSVAAYLEMAKQKASLVTSENYNDLKNFQQERQELNATIDNVKTLLSANIAKNLEEPLRKLNEWLDAHGEEITLAMEKLGTAIAKVINWSGNDTVTLGKVVDVTTDAINIIKADTPEEKHALTVVAEQKLKKLENTEGKGPIGKLLGPTLKGTDDIMDYLLYDNPADKEQIKLIEKLYKEKNKGKRKKEKLKYNELEERFHYVIDDYRARGGLGMEKYIEDGIIRPGGQVTRVAPDDWVFAARNIGDMARAFIPKNYSAVSAPSEYVINQTFNIGSTDDMPQVLKQQAYRGTQEGLLEVMRQSSQRLQLMSGTR